MAKCCGSKCCLITTSVIGLTLVIIASLLLGLKVADKLIDHELNKQLVLSLDSPVYSQWINPAPPIYMQYWMYNVTNAENITKGAKPVLKEVGPFTYRLFQPKNNVAFYGNDTVSYKYNHTIVYQRDMSSHDPDIRLQQLNVPLLTVQSLAAQNLPSWLPSNIIALLAEALDDSKIFVEHTAEEFLFGYDDPIFDLVHDILAVVNVDFPPNFGLFLGFNNSDDGTYLINSGRNSIMNTNIIEKWNGNKTLSWWSTPQANMINGTDGVFAQPKLDKSQKVYIFNTDLCRSVFLTFQDHTSVRGINTLRFQLPKDVFLNASLNPDNEGYCVPKSNCLDSGVLTLGPCKEGAPITVSSPHFYLAADQYLNGVIASKPNQENDETFLDIEPMSGAVFSAMKRLQVNVHVKDEGLFPQLKNIKEVMFPVLWLNESVYLDESSAHMFKSQVLALVGFVHALPFVIMGVGVFLLMLGIALLFRRKVKSSKTETLLSSEERNSD